MFFCYFHIPPIAILLELLYNTIKVSLLLIDLIGTIIRNGGVI